MTQAKSNEFARPIEPDSRPVLFGEVTLETYPDGRVAVGGSPFNIAWHLRGFGADPLLISKVGQDDQGGVILQLMRSWGMDLSGLQHDSSLPTSTTSLSIVHGQPVYATPPAQAYDSIGAAEAINAISRVEQPFLLHGILALREFESQATLEQLVDQADTPVFVDANLRDPWWRQVNLIPVLSRANVLRLSDDELQALIEAFGYTENSLAESLRQLHEDFSIDVVIVTLGSSSAMLSTLAGEAYSADIKVDVKLVDTVGVRDAFTAVAYLGLLKNWPAEQLIERALQFAALISALPGATHKEASLYETMLEDWL